MLNLIWLILILGGIVAAAFNGRIDLVTESFFSSADEAVNVCLDLIGMMTLWYYRRPPAEHNWEKPVPVKET